MAQLKVFIHDRTKNVSMPFDIDGNTLQGFETVSDKIRQLEHLNKLIRRGHKLTGRSDTPFLIFKWKLEY